MSEEKLIEIEKKTNLIHKKIHRIYVMFIVMSIVNILFFIVPLLLLVFVIPWAMNILSESYNGLL